MGTVTISTHVLNTAEGIPAAGVKVTFAQLDASGPVTIANSIVTNADGRAPEPFRLEDPAGKQFQLSFAIGDYFRTRSIPMANPPFLDIVPIVFGISQDSSHYHIPLLCSPWSYSTYRGS